MRRRRIVKARKVAYIFAALLPDRISLDAAELAASRVHEMLERQSYADAPVAEGDIALQSY